MATMLKIAITGAAGKMGRRIAALAIESERFDVVSAMEVPGNEAIGADIGELAGVGTFGLEVTDDLSRTPQVVIDFSLPEGTMHWLSVCRAHGIAMGIGTTGLTESQAAEVADAASVIPIVHAANMSVGVNLLLKLVAETAVALGEEYDIDISETHHRFKKDAPSGTAIAIAKSICQARDADYGQHVVFGRGGQEERKKGEIGIHALRVGDTVGEHTVFFGNLGETVSLSHVAHTRNTFARGALRAAQWLASKEKSLYDMQDVLGLK